MRPVAFAAAVLAASWLGATAASGASDVPQSVLDSAAAAIHAHRFATAERVLSEVREPRGTRWGQDRRGWDAELLRAEARAFAPGPCDSTWTGRVTRLTDAFAKARPSDQARAWTSRSGIETRLGWWRKSEASARRALQLLADHQLGEPRLHVEAHLALAEVQRWELPDSTIANVRLAEDWIAHEPDSLASWRPRAWRLKQNAAPWGSPADPALSILHDALEQARNLPREDVEEGRVLWALGMAQLTRDEWSDGEVSISLAVDTLAARAGWGDERTVEAVVDLVALRSTRQVRLGQARELLERVENAQRSRGAPDGIEMGFIQVGWFRYFAAVGRGDESERATRRALEFAHRFVGDDHKVTWGIRLALAVRLARNGRPREAIDLWQGCLENARRLGAGAGRDTFTVANNIGWTLAELGELDAARERLGGTFRSSLRSGRSRGNFEVCLIAASLAAVERALGHWDAAESLAAGSVRYAFEQDDLVTGQHRDDVLLLGELLSQRGRSAEAIDVLRPALDVQRQVFEDLLPWLTDDEAHSVALEGVARARDLLLGAARGLPPLDRARRVAAFTSVAKARALSFDALLRRVRGIVDRDSSEGEGHTVAELRRQLALDVLASFRSADGPGTRVRRDSLRAEIRRRERSGLATRSGPGPDWRAQDLAQALPDSSALVTIFQFDCVDTALGQSKLWMPGVRSYVAAVVRSRGRDVAFVDLGPAAPIDTLLGAWREAVGNRARRDLAGSALRRAVWDPLVPSVRGAHRVLMVVEGALQSLPFQDLPAGDGRFLIEQDLVFHRLDDEDELLGMRGRTGGPGSALLVGAVDYATTPATVPSSNPPGLRSIPGCSSFVGLEFPPVPGTRLEIEGIESTLQRAPRDRRPTELSRIEGALATEAAFKALAPGHRVIHVATHGFYVPPECPNLEGDEALVRENPLVFSGLALAGANHAWEAQARGEEDGLLTAEELAGMDLRSTDWLVLSGCESGLGQVRASEALYGLPRAANAAGARTTIMSVWPVDDEATAFWMRQLYRARYLHGEDTADAVRAASLATLARLRALGRDPDPRLWGAFVAVGDWR